jgi:hypothetical protein
MDGVLIDSIEGANLPATITSLTTAGGPTQITVMAKDREDCTATLQIELEECRTVPCDISNLVADAGSCTSDSTFSLALVFSYQGFKSDFVDLYTGVTFLGQFASDSLPIVINDFPWNGESTMSLRVCQSDSAQCCEEILFAAPFCGCEVDNIVTDPFCTSDSATFALGLDVEWRGDISGFTVHAGAELIAVIDAASLPDTLYNFPFPPGDTAEITVCATNNSTCCATSEFEVPDCGDTTVCEIFIMSVDTFQCGESAFSAWVDYTTVGFTGLVDIWANDTYLGEFPQFHPHLLSIPQSEGTIVLRICNAADPDCCDEIEFQAMHCDTMEPPCMISELTASIASMDSATFMSVTLDFEFQNQGVAFTVSGNGNQYGVFTYNNVPVTLPPLPCDTSTSIVWQFVVQDLPNINCFDFVNVGVVDCDTLPVGLFGDPLPIEPLEILYSQAGPEFVVPEGATEFSLWTYDGRLIGVNSHLTSGDRVSLAKYIPVPGLYFIQVRSGASMYVGKVVGFQDR